MTRLSKSVIYVEGRSDKDILSRWFPDISFERVDGEKNLQRKMDATPASWGIKDRDFATQVEVDAAKTNRLTTLQRYCIENYLLEPSAIASVAQKFEKSYPVLSNWTNEAYVQQNLFKWAKEVESYAAANVLIYRWRQIIEGDFLKYLGPLPAISYEDVLAELQGRLRQLPSANDIEQQFEKSKLQVSQDIVTLDGVHQWITGKVLLDEILYQRVFKLHNFGHARLRDELIEVGKNKIPDELVHLAKKWQ